MKPKHVSVKNAEAEFCQLWPEAKKAIELMTMIQNNPAANLILATVKAAGDAIVRKANN